LLAAATNVVFNKSPLAIALDAVWLPPIVNFVAVPKVDVPIPTLPKLDKNNGVYWFGLLWFPAVVPVKKVWETAVYSNLADSILVKLLVTPV
jgi:hypothetical protein